ncbi:protein prenyltransferase alpha subunit repeat-containing protein 1 [Erpetoichthys calabaricus]|uniref:Protein prenyltransferase alpha subunit repeat containing 1 n=1 Tax=Erpetoichthys calabaricus TaxID=27687 RepID=A0A8C4RJ10_ERPCA|nr:protein prenyltransferase alpha subunit repeat-containing protein 1 [Erpetoichthys calabaricus]
MAELEEEVGVLVQRVVKDINSAFKKNPNIDEIGLIPCPEARYNRSPIVLVENKLGVESWCIKFLLPYVHNKLLLFRQRKQWFDRDALIDITCTLLLLNPDFTTAWNVRKELIQFGALSPEKDLYLGKLALTKFPKSPETWIHRRWVLKRLLQEHCPHSSLAKDQNRDVTTAQSAKYQEILHDELKVCTDAAGRYPSNYNAWSHRIWVLQNMAEEDSKIIYDELCSSKYWVSMHISDHSGFHYRQFLFKSLIRRSNFILDKTVSAPSLPTDHCASLPKEESSSEIQTWSLQGLFDEELDLCNDLIESYPGHEALWCHRRLVFFLWHHWSSDHHSCGTPGKTSLNGTDGSLGLSHTTTMVNKASQVMDVDCLIDPSLQSYSQETKRLKRGPQPDSHKLLAEHRFVSKILSDCGNMDQVRFATSYKKWLDSVIGQL